MGRVAWAVVVAMIPAMLALAVEQQPAPEFRSFKVVVRKHNDERSPDLKAVGRAVETALGKGWGVAVDPNDAFQMELLSPASSGEPPRTAVGVWAAVHHLHATDAFTLVEPILNRPLPIQPGSATPWHGECQPSWSGTPEADQEADQAFTDSTWSLRENGANVVAAWKYSMGDGVVIAHPDTGYLMHPAVTPALLGRGFNFTSSVSDALDDAEDGVFQWAGHGTRTGSVIAGRPYALEKHWISGAAPGAMLMPLKVAHRVVLVDWIDEDVRRLAVAIRAAAIGDPNFVRRKADIISMSLGGPSNNKVLQDALAVAEANNVIVLAAAGNQVPGRATVFPALFPNVIGVAASNYNREPWSGTSRGKFIAFAAPGQNVWTAKHRADADQSYDCIEPSSGTSYAVATSAGVAALWVSYHRRELDARPDIDRAKVFKALAKCTARPITVPVGRGTVADYGGGILDAAALLAQPLPTRDGPALGQSDRCIRELRTVPPRPLVAMR
jgi:serine protease